MASPEYPSGELVSTQLPGHRAGTCSLEVCSYPGRIRSGWRAALPRGPFLRGHRVGSSMPDDSLRSHARWSLRVAVFLTTFRKIIFRLKSGPVMTGCRLHRLFRHADLTHFLCIVEPKKVGQRNLRIASFSRDYHAVAASTEPLLPAARIAAEIGSLRSPDASRRPCVRLLPTRSSLRAFRAPLKGSKVSVHSSLPLSVPRRGNLLLSFQRDKRSKTASAFFVLGTQRNPNQRKVIHLIILAQCAATIRPKASRQTCGRSRGCSDVSERL